MSEKHRETDVPVVECLGGLARITSKELAPIHSVKSGILQNACSTSPKMVAGLGKGVLMRIVRLMNSRLKGPKRMMTKVLKKGDWHESVREPVINNGKDHDRSGRPDEKRDYELKRGPTKRRLPPPLPKKKKNSSAASSHRAHDIWVAYFKT